METFRDRKLGQPGNLEAERSRDSGQDGKEQEKGKAAHLHTHVLLRSMHEAMDYRLSMLRLCLANWAALMVELSSCIFLRSRDTKWFFASNRRQRKKANSMHTNLSEVWDKPILPYPIHEVNGQVVTASVFVEERIEA